MHADVKGFVQPKKVIRIIGLKIEDLKPLIVENFVIPFDSGVVVITGWNINNLTREDRESPTMFKEELGKLELVNGKYALINKGARQLRDNSGSTPAQVRLEENRLDKDRTDKKEVGKTISSINTEEIFQEIADKNGVPLFFVQSKYDDLVDYCESKGVTYKSYLAALRNWVKRDAEKIRKDEYHASKSVRPNLVVIS